MNRDAYPLACDSSCANNLIEPYGGGLTDLLVHDGEEQRDWMDRARAMRSIRLSHRSRCDLELLANGGFSPLRSFMGEADYKRVLGEMRLANGALFPIPLTLPVSDSESLRPGEQIALFSSDGQELLAVMAVDEEYAWSYREEALAVFGTEDVSHPTVAEMGTWGSRYISGPLRVFAPRRGSEFSELRRSPKAVRAALSALGRPNVVAFQTRNPIHRAHEELTKRAMVQVDGTLLIHPVIGLTRPGDIDPQTRVRCYEILVRQYFVRTLTVLSLLPLAMRMAGPREAVWHAIIRRNYGANYLIVGRDHAGPGSRSTGKPFYGPYEAQQLLQRYQGEIGVTPLSFEELVYLPDEDRYEERSLVGVRRYLTLSGSEVRRDYLARGVALPEWFTRPEVAAILSASSAPGFAPYR